MGEKLNIEAIVEARRMRANLSIVELDHEEWARARPVQLERYWSGEVAPPERQGEARLLWDERALHAHFVCAQREPLIVNEQPQVERKAMGLWDRDVCEMFIAPCADEPDRYFEFEVAPTGEWLDLAIWKTAKGRETDWNFHSGITVTTRINVDSIMLAMRVPWGAFGGVVPHTGVRWRVNLFRCIGAGPGRGYLAWQPTLTPEPNFHVPEKFGWLLFSD